MYGLKNRVQLIGHLGNAPEARQTESGKSFVRFSVATNETFRSETGEKVVQTQWHQLVAWGKVADISSKYLQKGSEVAVEGRLIHRSYTDKEGVKKYLTEVHVTEILFLKNTKQPASETEEEIQQELEFTPDEN